MYIHQIRALIQDKKFSKQYSHQVNNNRMQQLTKKKGSRRRRWGCVIDSDIRFLFSCVWNSLGKAKWDRTRNREYEHGKLPDKSKRKERSTSNSKKRHNLT
jgi:hypothetical protein